MSERRADRSQQKDSTSTDHTSTQTVRTRRRILAAASAAVAGLVVTRTSEPVLAAGNVTLANGILSPLNDETVPTFLHNSANNVFKHDDAAVVGLSDNGPGLYGTVNYAQTPQVPFSVGVYGDNGNTGGIGAHGLCDKSNGTGVRGTAGGPSGIGVLGEIPSNSSANGIAVYRLNYSTYAGPGPGAGGFGLYGLSAKGHGLVGAVATAGAAAVVGATNGVAGAYAAAFYGPVIVGDSLTVFGAKSAAVPHPDGSRRLVYCVESPESWFEDFSEGQLECGRTDVTLDPNFTAVADMEKYHVFLTEYDDHNALYVTKRTPTGFSVQAKDGSGSGAFSWRVVAKRKDIQPERWSTAHIPPEPARPDLPPMTPFASKKPRERS
jgi:hypothetical protein